MASVGLGGSVSPGRGPCFLPSPGLACVDSERREGAARGCQGPGRLLGILRALENSLGCLGSA